MKRLGLVIAILSCLLGLNAQSIKEYQTKASEHMSNGEFSEALAQYQQAIALVPDDTSNCMVYAYAGICAQQLDDKVQAKALFIESVNRGVEEPRVFDSLGDIARKEKDYDTQLLAYKAGVERSSIDKQKYLLKLCSVYKKQKDGDALLSTSALALENDANDLKALEYKGTGLQYQKKMSDAVKVFEEINTLDKENLNANIFLGNYNYQVGKNKLASARKKYDAIAKPTRVEWHDNNVNNNAIMAKYYSPAIEYLVFADNAKPNKSFKKMLFVMYTKMGEKEKAAPYAE